MSPSAVPTRHRRSGFERARSDDELAVALRGVRQRVRELAKRHRAGEPAAPALDLFLRARVVRLSHHQRPQRRTHDAVVPVDEKLRRRLVRVFHPTSEFQVQSRQKLFHPSRRSLVTFWSSREFVAVKLPRAPIASFADRGLQCFDPSPALVNFSANVCRKRRNEFAVGETNDGRDARARVCVREPKRAIPRRAGARASNSAVSRAFFRGVFSFAQRDMYERAHLKMRMCEARRDRK